MDTLVPIGEFNRLGAIVSPMINRLIDCHKDIRKMVKYVKKVSILNM